MNNEVRLTIWGVDENGYWETVKYIVNRDDVSDILVRFEDYSGYDIED